MKSTFFLALAAALPFPGESTALPSRRDELMVVSMQTERRSITHPVENDKLRLRRRGSVAATLDNEEILYFANVTIGTPPQSLQLQVDTGSSDLWVNTPSSKLCLQNSSPCEISGTYTANSSSTYEYVGSYFNISYVDGSGASGDYVTDTVAVGSQKLPSLQFGVGYVSSSSQGIVGIGYETNEVQVGRAGLTAYKNLPAQMVADGLIQSKAYSLWLNDVDANTGSILFGGVDTAQYTGSLQTVPIQTESGVFAEFLITLTGIDLGGTAIASDLALAVLLDSGSSLTYLPDSMVQDIYAQVGAQYDDQQGAAYVPCALAANQTSLSFNFSQPTIAVSMRELVLDLVTSSGKRPTFQDGTAACLFGLAPAGSGTNVLGDTFLRSAYVVYDLDNNAISLAPTDFNSTKTNVVEIGTGPGAVPDATPVTNAVVATAGIVGGNSAVGLGVKNNAADRSLLAAPALVTAAASLVVGLLVILA